MDLGNEGMNLVGDGLGLGLEVLGIPENLGAPLTRMIINQGNDFLKSVLEMVDGGDGDVNFGNEDYSQPELEEACYSEMPENGDCYPEMSDNQDPVQNQEAAVNQPLPPPNQQYQGNQMNQQPPRNREYQVNQMNQHAARNQQYQVNQMNQQAARNRQYVVNQPNSAAAQYDYSPQPVKQTQPQQQVNPVKQNRRPAPVKQVHPNPGPRPCSYQQAPMQPQPGPVIDLYQQPAVAVGDGTWSTDLFGCFDDVPLCCLTCWCPCIAFGRIVEIVDKGSTSCSTSGTIYGLILGLTGCQFIYSCSYRTKIRLQYGIPGDDFGDICTHLWCEGCALLQEYRELTARGYNVPLGWHANMVMQKQAKGIQMAAPVAPSGMTR